MKKKILFTASIAKHLLRFHLPYLKWFQENGYETHVACNGVEGIPYIHKQWQIDFIRTPYSLGHIKAYKQLKRIIDKEKYSLIHCHTPMASIITRLAATKSRKNGTAVLYTAHGFHFYKGAPLKNWIFYYPIEKLFSSHADCIITINQEDYNIIEKRFHCNDYRKIPGIGVDISRLYLTTKEEKQKLRAEYGYDNNDLLIIYIAEFISRKNHELIINSLPELIKKIPNIKVLFAGRGVLLEKLKAKAKNLNVSDHIEFLGFRKDIGNLINISDIGVSSSKQEGLALNLAEEMFCGLPVVATAGRGHNEMVIDGVNGYLFPQESGKVFIERIVYLYNNPELREKMGIKAYDSIKKFSIQNALASMTVIYNEYLSDV